MDDTNTEILLTDSQQRQLADFLTEHQHEDYSSGSSPTPETKGSNRCCSARLPRCRGCPNGPCFWTWRSTFDYKALVQRADAAWENGELRRITLHECRHTFASLMIAAGVNAKALSTYMGHANISITLDRYGHLMPGNEEEAASLLDAYLEKAVDGARDASARAAGSDQEPCSPSSPVPRYLPQRPGR
jgi:integrase